MRRTADPDTRRRRVAARVVARQRRREWIDRRRDRWTVYAVTAATSCALGWAIVAAGAVAN